MRIALVATLLVLACGGARGEHEGPLMSPGEDCMGCHSGREAHFTLAGTVFGTASGDPATGVSGATIIITDAAARETRLTTNQVGNFYTSVAITAPYTVAIERGGQHVAMSTVPSSGGCASCHRTPPANGAPGRLYVP